MRHLRGFLPRDRRLPGTLVLLDERGWPVANWACLGKADSAEGEARKNALLEPTLPYGNTPTGSFAAAAVQKFSQPHPRMGAWGIPLVGVAGVALEAVRLRSGLWIHGDGLQPAPVGLRPTHGCLRLKESSMGSLAALLRDELVTIGIEEI
jgi:hypothetical protein